LRTCKVAVFKTLAAHLCCVDIGYKELSINTGLFAKKNQRLAFFNALFTIKLDIIVTK